MRSYLNTLTFLCALPFAVGHSTFQELWVDGVDQAGTCARLPLRNSPVTSVTSNDIRCNSGTTPVATLCEVEGKKSFGQMVTN